MTATEHRCDSPVDYRGGAMAGLGAAQGYLAAVDSTAYGVEHSVAVSLALRELSSRIGADLRTFAEGGAPSWMGY